MPVGSAHGNFKLRMSLSDPVTRSCRSYIPSDGSEPLKVLTNGEPENVDEERAKEILSEDEFELKVDLRGGKGGGVGAKYHDWTCDFESLWWFVLGLVLIFFCV